MELNVQDWKEFTIGSIFEVINGKGITKEEISENIGDFPAIQSGEIDDGIVGYINKEYVIERKYIYTERPCLTVARSGSAGYVGFHGDGCVVGDSAKLLIINKSNVSKNMYLFLQTILLKNKFKYAYGRKVTEQKYKDEVIKLPILHNPDGTPFIDNTHKYSKNGYVPDWQFMEEYMKSLSHKSIETKIDENAERPALRVNEWKEFTIGSIFEVINGKGVTKEEISENIGDFPAIQSGEQDDGLIGYIDKDYIKEKKYVYTEGPCLTVAGTGSSGYVGCHSGGCVVGGSAKLLIVNKSNVSKNMYLFLQTILLKNKFKYNYGRKVTEQKYKEEIIKLPILHNPDGTPFIDNTHKYSKDGYVPDWKFMEDYMKSLPFSDCLK